MISYQIMLLQTLLFVSFILPFIHAFPVPQYKVATKIKKKQNYNKASLASLCLPPW